MVIAELKVAMLESTVLPLTNVCPGITVQFDAFAQFPSTGVALHVPLAANANELVRTTGMIAVMRTNGFLHSARMNPSSEVDPCKKLLSKATQVNDFRAYSHDLQT